MQCKDIQDGPIIQWLHKNTHEYRWATWGDGHSMPTVQDAMPKDVPEKLQLAKMRQLIKRGLVDGCTCGCRGDFFLTEKGKEWLEQN